MTLLRRLLMKRKTKTRKLFRAVVEQKPCAVIKALAAAGADPNARNEHGMTPLHVAAQFNENPAGIQALLDAGADPSMKDDDGKYPWDYART